LPVEYLIDTSAWLNIDNRADREDVWRLIIDLIGHGRIVAPAQVLGELRDSQIYKTRLKPHETALQAGDHGTDDISYLQLVGRITHDYPSMAKATGEKTPVDPYVVALAETEGYVVVTDESRKRATRKIPGVCDQRGIRCLTLAQFIVEAKK
jgi:hypothetical protein